MRYGSAPTNELSTAAPLIDEARLSAEATGNPALVERVPDVLIADRVMQASPTVSERDQICRQDVVHPAGNCCRGSRPRRPR
jgi:hypothetical protein